jgi:hypothetical protein
MKERPERFHPLVDHLAEVGWARREEERRELSD